MTKYFVLLLTLTGTVSVVHGEEAYQPVVSITAEDGSELAFESNAISNVQLGDQVNIQQIFFQVDSPTSVAFAKLTSENIGKQLVIRVCGEVVNYPVVQATISGGWLALSGLDWEHAQEVVDFLSGRRACN